MQRLIKTSGTLERIVADTYSAIYMEIQIHPVDKKRSSPKPVWHLEDETRPTLALCGFGLHETCKSVSPALAMLGKPCEACADIVADWLFAPKEEKTRDSHLKALLGNDIPFRNSVTKSLPADKFMVNYVGPVVEAPVEKAVSIAQGAVRRIRSEKDTPVVTRVRTGGRKATASRPR